MPRSQSTAAEYHHCHAVVMIVTAEQKLKAQQCPGNNFLFSFNAEHVEICMHLVSAACETIMR